VINDREPYSWSQRTTHPGKGLLKEHHPFNIDLRCAHDRMVRPQSTTTQFLRFVTSSTDKFTCKSGITRDAG